MSQRSRLPFQIASGLGVSSLPLVLAAIASGQSFNIDVVDIAGSPTDLYGAAANQPGHWNVLGGGPPYAFTIQDLGGLPTSITTSVVAVGNGAGDHSFDNPATSGDDEALMDDLQDVGNGGPTPPSSTTWTFAGLPAASYDIYVYAWAPDDPTFRSFVSICGSGVELPVGGSWPGTQVEGITFAVLTALPVGGEIEVCINSGGLSGNFSSVNGFQFIEGDPPPPGTPTCFGDGSGAVCGCGNESPQGAEAGCVNSLGIGAALGAQGSASLLDDSLVFTADGVTAQPGLFFQGDNLIGGGAGATFGDGIRCCGQGVIRLEIVFGRQPEPTSVSSSISVSRHPGQSLSAGDSKCYQYWYRDPVSSPCGTNFNLSNGYLVTWGV